MTAAASSIVAFRISQCALSGPVRYRKSCPSAFSKTRNASIARNRLRIVFRDLCPNPNLQAASSDCGGVTRGRPLLGLGGFSEAASELPSPLGSSNHSAIDIGEPRWVHVSRSVADFRKLLPKLAPACGLVDL